MLEGMVGGVISAIIFGIIGLLNSRAAYRNGVYDGFKAALRTTDPLHEIYVKPIIKEVDPSLWEEALSRRV